MSYRWFFLFMTVAMVANTAIAIAHSDLPLIVFAVAVAGFSSGATFCAWVEHWFYPHA